MVAESRRLSRVRRSRRPARSQRLMALAMSAMVGVCATAAGACSAHATDRLTAVGIRVGDRPAFVRAVVDFSHGTLTANQVEAIDPQPFDGTATVRLSHRKVQTRAAARSADGISVRVLQGVNGLRIDVRAARRRFKYLSYAVMSSNRLVIDVWKSAAPSRAVEARRGEGGCLTLDRARVAAGTVSAAGRERDIFEHQFQVVLRGDDGRALTRRPALAAAGRWSAQLRYRAARGQVGTLEGVALSAKDGALACLVQVRVTLPALAGAVSSELGRGGPSAGSTPPRCSTSNLSLEFVRATGATSHRYWDLALRNGGSATCHLRGYPGVGLLDRRARLIHVRVDRVTGFPVRNVVLHPWQRAFFTFTYVVSGPCLPHYFSAYGLEVFPPDNRRRMLLYHGRFDVCAPSVGGHPGVYPVRPKLSTFSR